MKKLTITLCCLVALASALTARAQSDTTKHKGWSRRNFAGAAQIQGTYRQAKLGQLNTILNRNGFSNLSANDIWINLSMSHIHKNWLFEDGIGATPTSTANGANNMKAKYNQFQFYTRAGYNLSKNSNYRVYPFAGINLSEAMLRIEDKNRTQSTSDFSTELLTSSATKTLWNPRFGIELGGGFDYVIKLKAKQMDCYTIQRNIPIGFRIGYYLQVTDSDWKIDNNYSLNNGPGNKQSNIFATLNIGLGYAIKK